MAAQPREYGRPTPSDRQDGGCSSTTRARCGDDDQSQRKQRANGQRGLHGEPRGHRVSSTSASAGRQDARSTAARPDHPSSGSVNLLRAHRQSRTASEPFAHASHDEVEDRHERDRQERRGSIPPKTTVPSDCWLTEPAPPAVRSGTIPEMNAIEVIRIGRNRRRVASTAASRGDIPSASSSRANSTIRMAFFAARAIISTSPICVYKSFGNLRITAR